MMRSPMHRKLKCTAKIVASSSSMGLCCLSQRTAAIGIQTSSSSSPAVDLLAVEMRGNSSVLRGRTLASLLSPVVKPAAAAAAAHGSLYVGGVPALEKKFSSEQKRDSLMKRAVVDEDGLVLSPKGEVGSDIRRGVILDELKAARGSGSVLSPTWKVHEVLSLSVDRLDAIAVDTIAELLEGIASGRVPHYTRDEGFESFVTRRAGKADRAEMVFESLFLSPGKYAERVDLERKADAGDPGAHRELENIKRSVSAKNRFMRSLPLALVAYVRKSAGFFEAAAQFLKANGEHLLPAELCGETCWNIHFFPQAYVTTPEERAARRQMRVDKKVNEMMRHYGQKPKKVGGAQEVVDNDSQEGPSAEGVDVAGSQESRAEFRERCRKAAEAEVEKEETEQQRKEEERNAKLGWDKSTLVMLDQLRKRLSQPEYLSMLLKAPELLSVELFERVSLMSALVGSERLPRLRMAVEDKSVVVTDIFPSIFEGEQTALYHACGLKTPSEQATARAAAVQRAEAAAAAAGEVTDADRGARATRVVLTDADLAFGRSYMLEARTELAAALRAFPDADAIIEARKTGNDAFGKLSTAVANYRAALRTGALALLPDLSQTVKDEVHVPKPEWIAAGRNCGGSLAGGSLGGSLVASAGGQKPTGKLRPQLTPEQREVLRKVGQEKALARQVQQRKDFSQTQFNNLFVDVVERLCFGNGSDPSVCANPQCEEAGTQPACTPHCYYTLCDDCAEAEVKIPCTFCRDRCPPRENTKNKKPTSNGGGNSLNTILSQPGGSLSQSRDSLIQSRNSLV